MATELSKEQVADLKAKHGQTLVSFDTPDGEHTLVFKKPSKQVWASYQEALTRERVTRSAANLTLTLDCVVIPESQKDASDILDKFPAMPTLISNELTKLAGLSDEISIKKL